MRTIAFSASILLLAASIPPSPPPANGDDAAMALLARSLVVAVQNGSLDRSLFSREMNDAFTPQRLASISKDLGRLGAPTFVWLMNQFVSDGYSEYDYLVGWSNATVKEQIVRDGAGKIAGWTIEPAAPKISTTEEPTKTILARSLLEQAQSGQIDRSRLDARTNEALTSVIVASMKDRLAPLGAPVSIRFERRLSIEGLSTYEYIITWPSYAIVEEFAIGSGDNVVGWNFKPVP